VGASGPILTFTQKEKSDCISAVSWLFERKKKNVAAEIEFDITDFGHILCCRSFRLEYRHQPKVCRNSEIEAPFM